MVALEKMAVKNYNIKKKRSNGGWKKNIEEVARRMSAWEVEEASGEESVYSFE